MDDISIERRNQSRYGKSGIRLLNMELSPRLKVRDATRFRWMCGFQHVGAAIFETKSEVLIPFSAQCGRFSAQSVHVSRESFGVIDRQRHCMVGQRFVEVHSHGIAGR
ncbi:hypothetical protein WS71_08555 [Burkholderia mayonis]|uniref:Uncharacterized protein n=1 Tax=Burkholderia mayonis TaxID=1385591 RepID=A0A1B4FUN2_9BURK|nr:hypothetical protein WS71_08555 [Burkholderia mayonis]KVE52045.1 hypothetical protein WS71_00310 [Burkholderia mayonis]